MSLALQRVFGTLNGYHRCWGGMLSVQRRLLSTVERYHQSNGEYSIMWEDNVNTCEGITALQSGIISVHQCYGGFCDLLFSFNQHTEHSCSTYDPPFPHSTERPPKYRWYLLQVWMVFLHSTEHFILCKILWLGSYNILNSQDCWAQYGWCWSNKLAY